MPTDVKHVYASHVCLSICLYMSLGSCWSIRCSTWN